MLQIQNLCKVFYPGTVNENILFNNFNLRVEDGDFITIIGSNGAGKSTLLNIISGTLKCDAGKIVLDGSEIQDLPEYKISRYMGRVFQDPSSGTAPSMTILENLSMAENKCKSFNLSPGVSKKSINKFKDMLSSLNLGLEEKLNTKVGLLSGGQRQALSLIMAVMSKPKLLLLDEHTAALDPKTSEKIIDITSKVVEENKITTLMVTHNLSHAVKTGNRLLMMNGGKIAADIKGSDKDKLDKKSLLAYFKDTGDSNTLSDRSLLS